MTRDRTDGAAPAEAGAAVLRLFTVGHSTRTLGEFVSLLRAHGVSTLVDVRTVPRSRRVPWFNAEALGRDLALAGLAYVPMKRLGGLRKPRPDSTNVAWRNASFRGYADYMQTPEFDAALAELMKIAANAPAAIMCAEAVPWRCHRSLIADALVARGWEVIEILGPGSARRHVMTPFAKAEGGRITYPVPPGEAES